MSDFFLAIVVLLSPTLSTAAGAAGGFRRPPPPPVMPPPGQTTVTVQAYDTVVLATYYEIDPTRCQAWAEPVVAISQQPAGAVLYLAHTRALQKGIGQCPPILAPQVQVMLRAGGQVQQGTYKWRASFQRYGTPADVTGTVSVTAAR